MKFYEKTFGKVIIISCWRYYFFVITSYSIHYTKLYDHLREVNARAENDVCALHLIGAEIILLFHSRAAYPYLEAAEIAEAHVITSYSIHYTKLYEFLDRGAVDRRGWSSDSNCDRNLDSSRVAAQQDAVK